MHSGIDGWWRGTIGWLDGWMDGGMDGRPVEAGEWLVCGLPNGTDGQERVDWMAGWLDV